MTCQNHPDVETGLRCNKCGKPICAACAILTPVGYRCRACVNVQQAAFYAGFRPGYYLLAVLVALPLSLIAGWIVPRLGWYAVLLGPAAGGGIAEATRWAIRRRRGRYTWLVVCGSIVAGALPMALLSVLSLLGVATRIGSMQMVPSGGLWRLLWLGIYLLAAVGAAYARLRTGRSS